MTAIKMQIEKRSGTGKNVVDKMRENKTIPAVIYSRGEETVHVSINEIEFLRVYKLAGSSSLLGLEMDGETVPAIIKEIQRHPFKNQVLHVDFQKLNMDEKVKMTVPVILVNRDSIKLQPSILMQLLDQIEIECLPGNIPNGAELNVEDMDFTTPLFVKDLDIAKDENINILRDLEDVVCTLAQPNRTEEEDEETEASEETETSEETPEDAE